ncbi:hypothetical protein N7499_008491 [Penicillium canescens]|uniref:DUF3824 domain-containing protein n=1 Tax=Penicillium canescens TaxID=5083 RepID=A0AAD6N2A8_PENCN|nr:uncharacterized protein N7446_013526 [Penicillium canescens]KAJ5985232.1 hypothetical protein N7522_012428 [Penicillium canescens]KAJ6023168.1 hypothetical protein N7460_013563 [Penicillium canescens]KAJ6025565.1 hypothetical protein N7444_013244 [Penicillium canescens]KAJ6042460.1 hypothetical protein N7446_013526 [Penicillium canescens]KAJ6076510.1 hypothetical protein N7499_008491 [Penicillium canescens]
MAYYEDRRYAPRDRYSRPATYVDPYDDPRGHYARHDRDPYSRRVSDDSIEEVQRDYPPDSDYVYERGYTSRRPRASRPVYENVRRASSVSGYDPHYDAAYSRSSRPRRSRHYEDKRSRRSKYDSDSSPSRSPPRHGRRKSFSEQALGALGLGGAAASASRGRSKSRHRNRSYSRSPSDSRSRSRHRGSGRSGRERSEQRIAQAARAALTAGAIEAFKQRKEPGDWAGAKGKRILTAAVAAGGTDGLVDKDPNKHSKRHVVESTLAGLAASHFVGGGSRSRSRGRNSRGGSGGGLKDLAASGALAAAGKEVFDRFSRSRSRPRGRADSRSDDERGSKKRSKSVSEYISKGLAALGLGEEERSRDSRDSGDRRDRDHHRDHRDSRDRRHRRDTRHDDYSDSDADSDYYSRDSRRGRGSRDVGRHRSLDGKNPPYAPLSAPRGENGAQSKDCGHHSNSESDSDLGDSSDEKKQRKKLKRDMLLTSGLASVATIHAAHGLYGSMEKRKKRMQQLKEGEITPEEARKRRMKANSLDAVSIGLAALGIKGAYSEWKEVNEKRKENHHYQEECAQRATKRELRRARSQGNGSSRKTRWPDEIEYAPSTNDSFDRTPVYHDGNPYGVSEAPQISY